MPEHVEPRRALGPGAEQACRREQAGERERVSDGHERGEQVRAGQHAQGPRSKDAELTEEQDRRDQVVDHERRFVDRNEGPDLAERPRREGCQHEEDRARHEHNREREPALAAFGPRGGQKHHGVAARDIAHGQITHVTPKTEPCGQNGAIPVVSEPICSPNRSF